MYARNPHEVSILHLLFGVTFTSIAALGIALLSLIIYKNVFQSLLFTNALWIFFYTLTPFCHSILVPISRYFFDVSLLGYRIFRVRNTLLITTILGLFLIHRLLVQRIKSDFFLKAAYMPIAIFLAMPFFTRITTSAETNKKIVQYEQNNNSFRNEVMKQLSHDTLPDHLPDIYFIILDAYSSNEFLTKSCGYDNSQFLNKLRKRSFYVAEKSHSNYHRTRASIPCTLNLNYLSKDYPENYLWHNDNASFVLKQLEYNYMHLSPQIKCDKNEILESILHELHLFLTDYFHMGKYYISDWTPLYPFFANHFEKSYRKYLNNQFEKLNTLVGMKSPKYIFAHLLIPHMPHVFDRNGNPFYADTNKTEYEKYTSGYVESIRYANKRITEVIDNILTHAKTPPIIILQGDHSAEFVPPNKRFQILSAYHLPNNGSKHLYQSISPVNNFRIIFNHYFGTHLKLLEDKSQIIED
jgi:hypothetical protein